MRVLCFVEFYLPGYKAGGAIRSIANMVELLGDEIEFLIVTRDRDLKDDRPYTAVQIDGWNQVGKAKVFYASPSTLSFIGVMKLLKKNQHNVLYLNCYLGRTTILAVFNRAIGSCQKTPIIIAPRGEFSVGALGLKAVKKKIYFAVAKALRLYHNMIWQASSADEVDDIRRLMGDVAGEICIAPDLLHYPEKKCVRAQNRESINRKPGPLRIIFLSRISPKKNLDFLLRILGEVSSGVQVSIYGPAEDTVYWADCENLIQTLPANISVTRAGEVAPEEVAQVFTMHDLFVFPTKGENFGHVIFESLSAGTAVIVSDQTPWIQDAHCAVEVLSLKQTDAWVSAIERWTRFNDDVFADKRMAAVNYARQYVETSQALEQNRCLFQLAFERGKDKKCAPTPK